MPLGDPRGRREPLPLAEAGWRFPVPVAHAEGRFTCLDDATYGELEAGGRLVLRYVDADGSAPGYPGNPNGSRGDVAGICDPSGRVVGLMPHPERNLDPWNHPRVDPPGRARGGRGTRFYEGLVAAARSGAAVASAGPERGERPVAAAESRSQNRVGALTRRSRIASFVDEVEPMNRTCTVLALAGLCTSPSSAASVSWPPWPAPPSSSPTSTCARTPPA